MDPSDPAPSAPLGDGRTAVAVDRPRNLANLREAVASRAAQGLAIYPQGGRTALDYGGVPDRPGVALDVSGLDAVIDYPAADMTITVQAGITLAKLQSVLATEGQFLPLDAPAPDRATIGGIYATNTSGPRRFGWGRPRDLIIGVSFVTADGKEVKGGGRVVKNVAGYDFPKLITGSMGTLGVIAQMTLKVRPKPESSALVAAPFGSLAEVAKAVDALNLSKTRPVAIDVLNAKGREVAGIDGLPGEWTLIAGFEDNAASVAWQVENVELPAENRAVFAGEDAEALWSSLAGFAARPFGRYGVMASLRRSRAGEYLGGIQSDPNAIRWHAGSGVVHLLADEPGGFPIEPHRSLAAKCGGGLIFLRCPTEEKAALKVWGERRGDWAIMERIKAALDPSGVMNPGRFVGTI